MRTWICAHCKSTMVPGSVYCGLCDKVSVADLSHPQQQGSQTLVIAPMEVFLMAAVWDGVRNDARKQREANQLLGLRKPTTGPWIVVLYFIAAGLITPIYNRGGGWAWAAVAIFLVIFGSGLYWLHGFQARFEVERARRLAMADAAYGS